MNVRKKKMTILSFIACFMMMLFSSVSVFAAGKMATARIPVSCTGTNTSETFTYVLTPESREFQTISSETLSLKNGEEGEFSIIYTYPGTYHYTVYQEKGSDKDTTYDDSVYNVDVYVTEDDNGKMYAEPVIYIKGDTAKKEKMEFNNKKTIIQPVKPSGNVKTGDDNVLPLYAALFIASGIMLILLAKKKRSKGGTSDEA